jgi:hypothetical protein
MNFPYAFLTYEEGPRSLQCIRRVGDELIELRDKDHMKVIQE